MRSVSRRAVLLIRSRRPLGPLTAITVAGLTDANEVSDAK
jgi:hypothetical protein